MPRERQISDDDGWLRAANCRGVATSTFFADDEERGQSKWRREAIAKEICLNCAARNACLDHALRVPERYGVWGGMSAPERERLQDTEPRPQPAN
jgi:WhiB family transcriptional regulator, redox-sensing transcriptional regulator